MEEDRELEELIVDRLGKEGWDLYLTLDDADKHEMIKGLIGVGFWVDDPWRHAKRNSDTI